MGSRGKGLMKVSSLLIRQDDVNGISGLTMNDYNIPNISAVNLRNLMFPVHEFGGVGILPLSIL